MTTEDINLKSTQLINWIAWLFDRVSFFFGFVFTRKIFEDFYLKLNKFMCVCVWVVPVNPIFNNKYWNVYRFWCDQKRNQNYRKKINNQLKTKTICVGWFPSCVGCKKIVSILFRIEVVCFSHLTSVFSALISQFWKFSFVYFVGVLWIGLNEWSSKRRRKKEVKKKKTKF